MSVEEQLAMMSREIRRLKAEVMELRQDGGRVRGRVDTWAANGLDDLDAGHGNQRFGGNAGRTDTYGIQIARNPTGRGLFMTDEMVIDPTTTYPRGELVGSIPPEATIALGSFATSDHAVARTANWYSRALARVGTENFGVDGVSDYVLKAQTALAGGSSSAGVYSYNTGGYENFFGVGAGFTLYGVLSPSQITANQNNYNPTNNYDNAVFRLSTDASRDITGIVPDGDGPLTPALRTGRLLLIHNVGSFNIVLKDESASSTAANRFALAGDITLLPDQCCMLQYDDTTDRWRAIAAPPHGATWTDLTDGGATTLHSHAGGAWVLIFRPYDNEPPASAYATLDLRNGHPVLDFDGATDEEAVFTGVLPSTYAGGGLTVHTFWAFTSATSGTGPRVQASIERIALSSQDLDADSFATANSAGGTAPGTSGHVIDVQVAFTSGAQMDSLAAGELFRLKIRRDADGTSGTDNITTDAELVMVMVVET